MSVPKFDSKLATDVATEIMSKNCSPDLIISFVRVCEYLSAAPDELMSWRTKPKPSLFEPDGLQVLARQYLVSYLRPDLPDEAGTVPDSLVSLILQEVYDYTEEETEQIKIDHQRSMLAENCVGNLLERYIDSKLRGKGWNWCCGSFVRAVDFVSLTDDGNWLAIQIKNRSNSENSSSSNIRQGTTIQKWYRTNANNGKSMWHKLPRSMQDLGLSEDGFQSYVRDYIRKHKIQKNVGMIGLGVSDLVGD